MLLFQTQYFTSCTSISLGEASVKMTGHLRCLDPAIAIKPVLERFSSVVITSGTISPLDMYPKMLQFTPVVQETYAMSLTRNTFLPLVRVLLASTLIDGHLTHRYASMAGNHTWQ
jgi:Rad3-related DNA helicase